MNSRLLEQANSLVGTSISVDVSTGDHDFGHRIFATVIGVQDEGDSIMLLAEEDSRNFGPNASQPGQILDELQSLAARYPANSLDRVRMDRIVSSFAEQEARITERTNELRREIEATSAA